MESELFAYLRPVLRWSWVTVILVAATVAAIVYSNANVPLVYYSTVKLEVAAPEPEEVSLFSTVRTGTQKDEISAVQADFSGIVRGALAMQATIKELNLQMSWQQLMDKIWVELPTFSNFVYVHFQADNPNDAEAIARIHVENALQQYGEARAKPTTVRKQFIIDQMQAAGKELADAREAILRFQVKNGTADLSRDIQGYQDALRSLRLDRDRNLVEMERTGALAGFYTAQAQKVNESDPGAAASYRGSAAANQALTEGMRTAITRQNELIAQRENELLSLVGLSSEYDRLRAELGRADGNYQFLLGKLNEAQIKENDARTAGFIQIIEPAQVPTRPTRLETRNLLIPGLAASLIAGCILSFVLEYVFSGRARRPRLHPL